MVCTGPVGSCWGITHVPSLFCSTGTYTVAVGSDLRTHVPSGVPGITSTGTRPSRGGVHDDLVVADVHRRERRQRHADVDHEHRDDHEVDGARHVLARARRLLGHVGHRLDAGVGDGADGETVEKAFPGRCDPPLDLVEQDLRLEEQHQRDDHDQHLGAEIEHGEDDVEARRLFDADDVDHDEDGDGDRSADDVVGRVLEDRPEDREILRNEQRRDGDGRRVDEHLAPTDAEADELVEGASREARRASGLRHGRRRLGIRPGGGDEEEAGEDEDERRQAQRGGGDDAEGVVDGRADVAVRGAEQGRDPEHLVQRLSFSAFAACHAPAFHDPERPRRPVSPRTAPAQAACALQLMATGASGEVGGETMDRDCFLSANSSTSGRGLHRACGGVCLRPGDGVNGRAGRHPRPPGLRALGAV